MVWRKLVIEFEPGQPASALGRMRRLMSWSFGTATTEQDMNHFEVAVQLHERHSSAVPSDIKVAILVAGVQDGALQQWLMVNADKLHDYDGIAKHIKTYLVNRKTFQDAGKAPAAGVTAASAEDGGTQPMDIGALKASLASAGLSKEEPAKAAAEHLGGEAAVRTAEKRRRALAESASASDIPLRTAPCR